MSISSISTLPEERIALAPGRAARFGAAAGRRRQRDTSRRSTDPRSSRFAAAGRCARRQRYARHPCAARRHSGARRRGRAHRGHASQPRKRQHLARLCASGKAARASANASASAKSPRAWPACSPRSMRRSSAKTKAGRLPLAFDLTGPALDEAIARLGEMPLPPYIASRRADRHAGRARLSDDVRARARRRRSADGGLHFTPELIAALEARGIGAASPHASCRRRHVPAGESGGYARPSHARGVRDAVSANGRCAECGEGEGRSHRRGRHDGSAPARIRC